MTSFSSLAGDPAVDFVNTRPMRAGAPDERLVDWSDFRRWAIEAGLAGNDAPADGEIAQVRGLREALRRTFAAMAAGGAPDPADIEQINRALGVRRTRARIALEAGALSRIEAPMIEVGADLLAEVADRAARLLASPDVARLRLCEGAQCVLWFVDRTRNGSRTWCSMERCGARAKSAAYYRRRRAAA